jgi:hypothetical protein
MDVPSVRNIYFYEGDECIHIVVFKGAGKGDIVGN